VSLSDPLEESDNGTPLTDEERRGLLLPVLTRKELNRAEAENISQAMTWLFLSRRRLRPESVTREGWIRRLHQRMYNQVWAWAGQYRTTDRNLGVPCWQIRVDMRDLEADVLAWLADTNATRFSDDECAIRFGYRLVVIHPFPNGNGRWSRLASDALIVALGGTRFTWGGASLTETGQLRRSYITALQAADTSGDFGPLTAFARS
jgi:Fic-DOC domain mobile mystery protein B